MHDAYIGGHSENNTCTGSTGSARVARVAQVARVARVARVLLPLYYQFQVIKVTLILYQFS